MLLHEGNAIQRKRSYKSLTLNNYPPPLKRRHTRLRTDKLVITGRCILLLFSPTGVLIYECSKKLVEDQ